MDEATGKVRFALRIAGILADAEEQGYSYPLHVTVELADGRRLIDVYLGGGVVRSIRTLTPITDDSLPLPATVVVREWDSATKQPREDREIRAEIKTKTDSTC
ncbi:MAG TPA: hypothetical protein VGL00_21760 [Terracidiphilus sp.]|jgi:hypothetical protein